jgi:hypothetical protein
MTYVQVGDDIMRFGCDVEIFQKPAQFSANEEHRFLVTSTVYDFAVAFETHSVSPQACDVMIYYSC